LTSREIADTLLWPCWRGMPDAYKAKYARNIWAQFEDNIRSAAYTSSLARFFQTLSLKLDIEIRAEDVRSVNLALASDERTLLRALRDETTAMVLLVRLRNEERKQEYKDRQGGAA
jgi:hypothetical protein